MIQKCSNWRPLTIRCLVEVRSPSASQRGGTDLGAAVSTPDLIRHLLYGQRLFNCLAPLGLWRSSLRDTGLPHGVHVALALLQVNRIVTLGLETEPANGERWIKRQADLGFGACLLQLAEIS